MSLDRWFKEKWVDVKTGKPCGRKKGDGRPYPACRPSKRVSSKTPKTTKELSNREKLKFKTQAELTKAMSDPRYGKDQDYTLSVYKRLEDSKVVGNG